MEDPALCPAPFTQRGLYRNGRQITKREFASAMLAAASPKRRSSPVCAMICARTARIQTGLMRSNILVLALHQNIINKQLMVLCNSNSRRESSLMKVRVITR
jgi:hypothetical protein